MSAATGSLPGKLDEGVKGVGRGRLPPPLGPGRSEQFVGDRGESGHDLGAVFGIAARRQTPHAIEVGPGPEAPAGVDGAASFLDVGVGFRPGADAGVTQLGK
jgi:hypothetical protein